MATNTGKDYRKGSVKNRIQKFNKVTNEWVKYNTNTNEELERKKGEPFKGVAEYIDERL